MTYLEDTLYDLKEMIGHISSQNQAEKLSPKPSEVLVKNIAPMPIAAIEPTKLPIDNPPLPEIAQIIAARTEQNKIPLLPVIEEEPQLSWWENFREQNPDLEKFIGENLISKLGVLILVLGISYFVKFAIDKNWINETARVGIGFLCGGLVLGIAHKLRANYKAFSSVLVAGAIAIFYFTIAIAFHQYHIFGQTIAFILMVIITAFSVFISVSYDRQELAILSLIGGFAVPFMVSTGSGNYQILFGYISILDIGILAIAYYKRWSLVNVLAFIFTVLLFGGWLSTVINKPIPPYIGTLIFASIFFLIFIFTNLINNLKSNILGKNEVFSAIELSVIISNSFLYFSVGMIVLSDYQPHLKGLFTISLALFNLLLAGGLFKLFGLDKRVFYVLLGLSITFAILAVPIQFDGNYITLFWAAESVLLLWLSMRSGILQFRFASVIVLVLMLCSLIGDWQEIYHNSPIKAPLLLNGAFIAGVFATLCLWGNRYLSQNETSSHSLYGFSINPSIYQRTLGVLIIVILYLTGILETSYQADKFFINQFSALSLPVCYHLLFCVVLVYFFWTSATSFLRSFSMILAIGNIFFYTILFAIIPLQELKNTTALPLGYPIAFVLHYVCLACLIYLSLAIWKNLKTVDSLDLSSQKWFIWLSSLILIYLASTEAMINGMKFFETAPYSTESSVVYNNIIRVIYPILWGSIAFIFLTIGIKKQWKNLRIIALTLLGITIVKLFVYDIANVSETGKIIAFILLGVMILVMSFAYQKIKTIVLNQEEQ